MRAERGGMYVPPGPPRQHKRTQFRSRSIHLASDRVSHVPKELRDMYHSVYLLNRAPGFPTCGEVKRRRAIQEILSLLQDRLQRQTSSAEVEDIYGNKEEPNPPSTYKAALWIACQKAMETITALQSNLDWLDNELRGRL